MTDATKTDLEWPADDGEGPYRALWEENMPRVSGRMWFAIPGEQPIHVTDEQALHILTYLAFVVTDEAVELAAMGMWAFRRLSTLHPSYPWSGLAEELRERLREEARAALQAVGDGR